MKSNRLFGTDGIRGKANKEPISALMLVKVGKALVVLLKEVHPSRDVKIVIGRDTRISGFMIESALAAGICSQGGRTRLIGEMPTAGIAFMTMVMRADAGIVISASHNPFEDNGIKIFNSDGYKISKEWERRIEEIVCSNSYEGEPSGTGIRRAKSIADAPGRYTEFLKNTFPRNESLKGIKVVLDCAHGAAYRVAPMVFEELDAELVVINHDPDGSNINENCGAMSPEGLQERVQKEKADIGIALDGDADRFIAVDEKGIVRDGDFILGICAKDLKERNKLHNNTLVTALMSNIGLELAMKASGINMVRTNVGDRYVASEMRKHGYSLGGEQSGHIIFSEFSTTGDGILSALQLLSVMKKTGKSLSELCADIKKRPQILINVSIKEKKELSQLKESSELIAKISKKLEGQGRVLVRYSGTENVVRVMIEGENHSEIKSYAEEIAVLLKKELS